MPRPFVRLCSNHTGLGVCSHMWFRSNFYKGMKLRRTDLKERSHIARFSYDLEMKTCEQNRNWAIWLVCRRDTNACGFWLVKQTVRWKNFMPKELSRNQPILRFDVILQHDWLIEQCLLHIRVFFGGKTKSPCFDLFIHWLIKQITNTYWNHFSRSYENRSIR